MKALTVHPLAAWAIIHAGKDVENRTWPTDYRGPIVIHASSNEDPEVMETMAQILEANGVEVPEELEFGAIIGIVELVDVRRRTKSPWAFPGNYHWVLANPKPCKPVDIKGALRLWEVPSHIRIEPCD